MFLPIMNPQIRIEAVSGTDPDAQTMRSGSPQVEGSKVLQLLIGVWRKWIITCTAWATLAIKTNNSGDASRQKTMMMSAPKHIPKRRLLFAQFRIKFYTQLYTT